jgi:hypothetical protein
VWTLKSEGVSTQLKGIFPAFFQRADVPRAFDYACLVLARGKSARWFMSLIYFYAFSLP